MVKVLDKPSEAIKESDLNFNDALVLLNGGTSIARSTWGKDEYIFLTRELDNSVKVFKRKDGVIEDYKVNKKDEKATDWQMFVKKPIEGI